MPPTPRLLHLTRMDAVITSVQLNIRCPLEARPSPDPAFCLWEMSVGRILQPRIELPFLLLGLKGVGRRRDVVAAPFMQGSLDQACRALGLNPKP